MVLEYLSGNSLKKYPFDDNCTLTADDGYVLPNDVFLDLQYFQKTSKAYYVYMTIIGTQAGFNQVNVMFAVLGKDSGLIENVTCSLSYAQIVEKTTVTIEASQHIVKIVPGPGMVKYATDDVNFTHIFSPGVALLADSAVVQPTPRVKSVTFVNNGTPLTTIEEDELNDVFVTLEEGANTAFTLIDGVATIDIGPELGTGLYNPCGDDLVITSINSVPADQFGNFLFFTDGCYTSERGYENDEDVWIDNYGLTVTNICTPKCTAEQMTNFAHYLNRVKDGIDTIADEAATTANELKTQIEDYITAAAATKNKPYYKTSYSVFSSYHVGQYYYSIIISFHNPTEEAIPVTVTGSTAATVITKTIRYKSAEDVVPLATLSYTGEVPCIGVGRLEFVVLATPGATVTLTGTLDGVAFNTTLTLS